MGVSNDEGVFGTCASLCLRPYCCRLADGVMLPRAKSKINSGDVAGFVNWIVPYPSLEQSKSTVACKTSYSGRVCRVSCLGGLCAPKALRTKPTVW